MEFYFVFLLIYIIFLRFMELIIEEFVLYILFIIFLFMLHNFKCNWINCFNNKCLYNEYK